MDRNQGATRFEPFPASNLRSRRQRVNLFCCESFLLASPTFVGDKSYSCKNYMKTIRRAQRLPRISDAELVVMRTVWEKAPVTANQVVEALEHQRHWKPKTIHTLLRRLVQKGALDFDKK